MRCVGSHWAIQKALSPEDDGGTTDPHLPRYPAIAQTLGGKEDNPGTEDDTLRAVLGTDPGFQGSTFLGGYWEGIS